MMEIILFIAILILSVIIHELSHGYAAEWLGDPTARMAGRLTLNPLKHIDPVGSVIVPIITSLFGFTFGWAKPVPYNPYNLKNRRVGEVVIALAGPISNIVIALVFGTLIRFSIGSVSTAFLAIVSYIVIINIMLAVFNLIPIPPLDGSKVLLSALPLKYEKFRDSFESLAPFFIIFVVFILWRVITPVIPIIFKFFTGVDF